MNLLAVGRRPRSLHIASVALVAATATALLPAPRAAEARDRRPSIVFIVTDDQRWDTLWAMPHVRDRIVDEGVTFSNAFVVNPLCCPSRASILTGQYSHSTRVYTNKGRSRFGGFAAFDDRSTIATWLDRAGYRTGLFGKYINGYPGGYVPPGWDRWFATYDNKGYYDYLATEDGIEVGFGSSPEDYGTTVIGARAADFIRSADPNEPVFVYVAPHAPHSPAIPGPGDEFAFSTLGPWRPPAHNERNVRDKPRYIRDRPALDGAEQAEIDVFRLDQYRSLAAADRAVGEVMDALEETGRLHDTLVVFTSDNGLLWGEHRWRKKSVPYEESIRVPLVVRYDAMVRRAVTDSNLVTNIDLAPTAAHLAGVDAPKADGESLLGLLRGDGSWRSEFLIEHMSNENGSGPPTYGGVRTRSAVYVYYATGEEELYDLRADPDQLSNLAPAAGGGGRAGRSTLRSMRTLLSELCVPEPPGLSLPGWGH
jgi:N-acetylglucosamine-6-sulfatase